MAAFRLAEPTDTLREAKVSEWVIYSPGGEYMTRPRPPPRNHFREQYSTKRQTKQFRKSCNETVFERRSFLFVGKSLCKLYIVQIAKAVLPDELKINRLPDSP